jgi:N-acetyl-gamma-glutamyl-phosphate reductase
MIRAAIFGATGYTGIELIRILSSHPDVTISGGSSRNWAGRNAREIFTYIDNNRDFAFTSLDALSRDPQADVAFLALPHGESAVVAGRLLDLGLKVIDLSADLRLADLQVYAEWYGEHKAPELPARAVYGLPEIHRAEIKTASVVANPGCYPTTVILGTAPLFGVGEVDTSCPVVDAKSGISGAGRGAKLSTSFCESGEGFKPYSVTGHRHIPEMEQELSKLAGRPVKVRFTPHLIPVSRGMISTMHLPLKSEISAKTLREAYMDRYAAEQFVRVLPAGTFPDTSRVRGSNQCHISVEIDERTGWVIVMSAVDNLVKGASGEAVQNMNLMMGLDEAAGLTCLPFFP